MDFRNYADVTEETYALLEASQNQNVASSSLEVGTVPVLILAMLVLVGALNR